MSTLVTLRDLSLVSPACHPGSASWAVFMATEADLSAVMPYLNAVWPRAQYDHAHQILTCEWRDHAVALRPHEVAVSGALDRDDAERLTRELVDEINGVWERRGEITPRTAARRRPTAMAIFRLLPRSNCRACGQPSCYSFALQLVAGAAELVDCAPLQADDATHAALREILAEV